MWPSIAIGSVVIGCAVVDDTFLVWPVLIGASLLILIAAVTYFRQTRFSSADEVSSQMPMQNLPELSISSVSNGFSAAYSHDRVETDVSMGDTAAVASLVAVLDRSKEMNEPGWDEVCESIVGTIARTGDVRCLPALGRVRLTRGSRFTSAVDAAIAAIVCKQTA
jgi:hypothetical protein